MKTLLRLIGIAVASLVGVAIVLAIAGAGGASATSTSTPIPRAGPFQIDRLQSVDGEIVGRLTNLGNADAGSASVRFDLYTKNGAKIGEAYDSIGHLGASERWIFQAHILSSLGSVQYRLGEVVIRGRSVDVSVSFKEDENKPTPEQAKALAAAERERAEEGRRIEAAEAAAKVKRVADAKAAKQAKIDAAVQAFRDEQKRKAEHESAAK